MKLDVKNNRSEIKEVQDTIVSDRKMLLNANEVVKADSDKKYLMGINIPLWEFSTEVPIRLRKSFIASYDVDFGSQLGFPVMSEPKQVGVETKNSVFITLEIGTGITYFEHKAMLDKTLSSKEEDYKRRDSNRCSKLLSELVFDINSKSIFGIDSKLITDTPANRTKVSKILDTVSEIEAKLACKYELKGIVAAQLCIHSGLTIAEHIEYDKSFLDSLSEELNKLNEGFDEIDIDAYIKTYAIRKPVNAMNLIKIIKKGTDTAENLYTGKCDGIVVEVLTALENKSIFSAGELGIHKKFLNPGLKVKSKNYEGFGSGLSAMESTPIMTQTVNNNIYMASVKSEFKTIEETESKHEEIDNQGKHDIEIDISVSFGDEIEQTEFKQDTSIRMKGASHDMLTSVFGKPIEDNINTKGTESLASMFDEDIDISLPETEFKRLVSNNIFDTMRKSEVLFDRLILPENINLSESFKAKYI